MKVNTQLYVLYINKTNKFELDLFFLNNFNQIIPFNKVPLLNLLPNEKLKSTDFRQKLDELNILYFFPVDFI
jgi:hypothetical protein